MKMTFFLIVGSKKKPLLKTNPYNPNYTIIKVKDEKDFIILKNEDYENGSTENEIHVKKENLELIKR